jgi:O-antigen ligase
VDLFIWPLVVGGLVLAGSKEWVGFRGDVVARLLLAFLVVCALSLPIGIVQYHNLVGPRSFVYQVVLVLNFGAGYLILRRLEDIDLLIRAFVASTAAFCLVLSIYLLQAGILGSVHEFHNNDALQKAIYGWPNGYAVLVAVALVMCMYVISSAETRLVRRAYLVFAFVLSACLVLTFSKTGWVAFGVALWLLWLRFWSVRRQLLLLGGLVIAGLVLLLAANDSFRIQVFTLGTLYLRLRFVEVVLDHMNPLILLAGSGSQSLGTLTAPFANEQLIPGMSVGGLGAQDELLNILVKNGLLGLILLVAALVVVMWRTRRLTMSADSDIAHLFRYWYAASWAVIASLFSVEELHYWPVAAVFWLMAGAMLHMLPRAVALDEAAPPGQTAERVRSGDAPDVRLSMHP